MVAMTRYIMLVDMNSFFASCEQSVQPSLRNKPIIVGGSLTNKMKGLVIAASYEAKKYGVSTGLNMKEALKKCPQAIIVQRNHPLYHTYSEKIMAFLRLVGPTEIASIDEAYVDITHRVEKGQDPKTIASYIQQTLLHKLHLSCSIGLGPNKIIAKMAADIKKPLGYTQLGINQFRTYFHPQRLDILHGCGKRTAEKLNANQIYTIGDLAKADPLQMKIILGIRGELLHKAALGYSSDKLNPAREKGDKTIGKEKTFAYANNDRDQLLNIAKEMVHSLCKRLEEKRLRTEGVSIVYKTDRLGTTHSKSKSLMEATSHPDQIYDQVEQLFDQHLSELSLWLFGVRFQKLNDSIYVQLNMYDFQK